MLRTDGENLMQGNRKDEVVWQPPSSGACVARKPRDRNEYPGNENICG